MAFSTISTMTSLFKKGNSVPPVVDPAVLCWYDLADATTRLASNGSQITTNNTPIYKISDKSGNGYHLFNMSGSTTNPLITSGFGASYNVVQTSGTSTQCGFKSTGTSPPLDQGMTFFAVYKGLGGASGYNSLISKSNGNAPNPIDMWQKDRLTGSNAQSYAEHINSLMTHDLSVAASTHILFNANFGGSTKTYSEYLNGNLSGNRTFAILSYTNNQSIPIHIANRADNGTHGYNQIGEIIIYNGAISSTLRQKIEGYLCWKWGLQASLPAGHPYISAAPSGFSPLTG